MIKTLLPRLNNGAKYMKQILIGSNGEIETDRWGFQYSSSQQWTEAPEEDKKKGDITQYTN